MLPTARAMRRESKFAEAEEQAKVAPALVEGWMHVECLSEATAHQ
jgi:hypothetical protein